MRRILLLCGALGAVGCGPAIEVSPSSGSAFGHFPVTVQADALAQLDATVPWTVTVGGVAAYEVAAVNARTVTFTVQGHPQGGAQKKETAQGAQSLFGTILEHVVWDPKVDVAALIEPPAETQLDRVAGLGPTLALSTDLIGNDYNNVNLHTDGIPDLSALTPIDELRASVREVVARLDQTGAEVFLATGPDNTVLPSYPEKVQRLKDAGYSDEEATGWLTAMRARIAAFNGVLREETQGHPRIHVVDLNARVATILSEGVTINGQTLQPSPYGGLLSLDMMHFSDTGYAVLANFFLEEINAALGTKIPLADLEAVHAADPYSVDSLRAAGLSCAGVAN